MDGPTGGTDPMIALSGGGGSSDGTDPVAVGSGGGTEVPPASPELYDSSSQPTVVVDQGATAPAAATIAEVVTNAAATAVAMAVFPPTDRDVVLAAGHGMGRVSGMLVEDLIRYHHLLWTLHGKNDPRDEAEVLPLARHLVDLMKNGREFELAGLSDVPKPFFKSKGRFLRLNATTNQYDEVPDAEAEEALATLIYNEFTSDNLGDLGEAPYKNLRLWLSRQEEKKMENAEFMPEGIDAILLPCGDYMAEKMYENQGGNRMIFNLASQYVNCYVGSTSKRVAAALEIMTGLDDVTMDHTGKDREMTTTKNIRFLIRRQTSESAVTWDIMDPASAAEFCVMFVFEVFLEKDLHLQVPLMKPESVFTIQKPGTVPVHDPVDDDVLFGRGGMTNGHPGNRRFRDIIALHRPDYVRAQKMDKPSVAIKIIRAIRSGGPQPGRFLKKRDDGLWYDVGDRAAMEKTSQGLRERTNAEKRQRSALREALRIRKQDLAEGAETPRKKTKFSDLEEFPEGGMAALNYVGTNLPVPLSLAMKDHVSLHEQLRKKSIVKDENTKAIAMELNTEGLPPNAVDEEGNILVTDYDILCGRGGLTNHHKGNKRFRDIVALHRPDYVRAPKIQKPSVARVIVRAIRNGDPPGRFLRKDDITGKWIDIGDKKAAEKTSQALREKTGDEKGMTSPEGLMSLLPNHASAYTINPAMFASLGQPIQLLGNSSDGHHQKEDVRVEDIVVPSPMIGDMPEPAVIHGNAKVDEDDDDNDHEEQNADI